MVLNILTSEKRASVERYLDVEMIPSVDSVDHWNCTVRIVDPDPKLECPPYFLPNIRPADLARELEKWSQLHGDGLATLPVFFSKVEPQILAQFKLRLGG